MEQIQRKRVRDSHQEQQLEEDNNKDEEVKQEIWSWGAGSEGQLATCRLEDEITPQLINAFSSSSCYVISLSCGGAHAIALCSGGRVMTWGRGASGQLGHGDMTNTLQPKILKAFEGVVIRHASAGWNHSAFVSDNGAVFTCGDGSFGQLGHGDYKSLSCPKEISYFSSNHVEQVACGMRHTLVLLRENLVFGFGSGKRGQLGISVEKVNRTSLPEMTTGLTNLRIVKISANGDHSTALSDDGSLYTWGRGFGYAADEPIPRKFDKDLLVNDVALGWNHALLLTGEEGRVFMLGGDRHGARCDVKKRSPTSDEFDAAEVQTIHVETKVVQIASGAEHSAIVTDNGTIMTWGWGEHGQLGLGDTLDQVRPQAVNLGHKSADDQLIISRVYCGSGFTFVLKTYDSETHTAL